MVSFDYFLRKRYPDGKRFKLASDWVTSFHPQECNKILTSLS